MWKRALIFIALGPFAFIHGVAQKAAPVPAQFATAKTAFLSFAGAPIVTDQEREQSRMFYDGIYNALQADGHYSMTQTPAQAEVCMEFAFVDHAGFEGFRLAIYDCKLHALLWTLDEVITGALRASTIQKHIDSAILQVVADLNTLAAGKAPGALKAKNQK